MKYSLLIFFSLSLFLGCEKKAQKDNYVFLITIDGLRWQDLFKGADENFIKNKEFVKDSAAIHKEFWHDDDKERRKLLMPFLWNEIASKGQIYGNRNYENKVNLTNNFYFSYPGYSEILTGFADDERINSNKKINNPNKTILELLNDSEAYKNKVMAFASWDVFPFIINEERSRIPVNAAFNKAKSNRKSEKELFLDRLQDEIIGPWGTVRLDPFTHHYMLEDLKKNQPDFIYIAYGEPDDWAHDENYQNYLLSTRRIDSYIKELWDSLQNSAKYKNKSTLIITTDHGRGIKDKSWSGHGKSIPISNQTWLAILGPNIKSKGEVKEEKQLYTNQIAKTILEILDFPYQDEKMGSSLLNDIKN